MSDSNVAKSFNSIIAYLGSVAVDKRSSKDALSYYLRLGVLRLRLCRWYEKIAAMEGADSGSSLAKQSSTIRLLVREADAQAASTSRPDNWMLDELDFLSQTHHPNSKNRSTRTTLTTTALDNLIGQIWRATEKIEADIPPSQAEEVKKYLSLLRHQDATYIKGRPKANQQDLHLLEDNATQVDREFADLVAVRKGHQFNNTLIEGMAVVGDEIAADWRGGVTPNSHLYERTTVAAKGVAVMGNRLGGKSVYELTNRH